MQADTSPSIQIAKLRTLIRLGILKTYYIIHCMPLTHVHLTENKYNSTVSIRAVLKLTLCASVCGCGELPANCHTFSQMAIPHLNSIHW